MCSTHFSALLGCARWAALDGQDLPGFMHTQHSLSSHPSSYHLCMQANPHAPAAHHPPSRTLNPTCPRARRYVVVACIDEYATSKRCYRCGQVTKAARVGGEGSRRNSTRLRSCSECAKNMNRSGCVTTDRDVNASWQMVWVSVLVVGGGVRGLLSAVGCEQRASQVKSRGPLPYA